MKTNKRDRGQIALVLILVMTVVGAAAVSLAGRATVELKVQEINIDSSQAMLAAESGLENALKNSPNDPVTGTIDANTTYDVSDETLGADYVTLGPLKSGETIEINLVGGTGTQMRLYWESAPPGSLRGLYVSVVAPAGVEDYSVAPAGFGAGFDATGISSQTLGSTSFDYSRLIPFTAGVSTVMRVTALGGDLSLGYDSADGVLGPQLRVKRSVGTVTRGTDVVKQGLNYYESVTDEIPDVFGYTLFSGQSIIQ